MMILGKLIKIDDFKRLVIEVDEKTYHMVNDKKLKCWTYNNNYYMRVSLDKYDKNLVWRKFEPLVKNEVVIYGVTKPYLYSDPSGAEFKGFYYQLKNIRKAKPLNVEDIILESPPGLTRQ